MNPAPIGTTPRSRSLGRPQATQGGEHEHEHDARRRRREQRFQSERLIARKAIDVWRDSLGICVSLYRNPGAITELVCRDVMDCQLRIISTEATPSVIFISDHPGTGSDGVRECSRYR
ncbi:MAG TPA: hypothetical protein VFD36_21035 [Kofleriaceae bacterium]|nr:hypothetical protein [Kofleriaceae bacterium]